MIVRLARGDPGYPATLERRPDSPEVLAIRGSTGLLRLPMVAFFSSVDAPGEAVLQAYDLARAMRDAGIPAIGGFQSPLERECLDFLLRGTQPVAVCPARSLDAMRIPSAWREPLDVGRMLLLSPFPTPLRRPTAAMSELRNRLVAALAERILVVHATPGGRVYRIAAEALRQGKRVLCADLSANHDLRVLGAEPVDASTLLP